MSSVSAPDSSDPGFATAGVRPAKTPWYEDLRVIGVLLLLVGMLALPLVWFNKRFTLQKKVAITSVSVLVAGSILGLSFYLTSVLDLRTTEVSELREALIAKLQSDKTSTAQDLSVS